MRLEHLTLNKLVDVAYWCGCDGTPVHIFIAAPPGSGKTWTTKSLIDVDFVQYLDKVYSPNEHRKVIGSGSARTLLLINDDIGMLPEYRRGEYFSTFIMIIDGELQFTVWKSTIHKFINCSVVLCCTTTVYYEIVDALKTCGLFDRIVPIVLGLSAETRRNYQKMIFGKMPITRKALPREPEPIAKGIVKTEILSKKNIDPRLLTNLIIMSQYLTDEETEELVAIAHSNGKYEI